MTKRKYLVLVRITNKKTGITFLPGSHIVTGDFPPDVIKNWLEIKPPVLAKAELGEEIVFTKEVKATEKFPDGKEQVDG